VLDQLLAPAVDEAVGNTTFDLSSRAYGLNQLRYDLRKLKGHTLLQRDGSRYAYRLTTKGVEVALLFLFFHKRLCGPLDPSRAFNNKRSIEMLCRRQAYNSDSAPERASTWFQRGT
jgi:hypothetical protein